MQIFNLFVALMSHKLSYNIHQLFVCSKGDPDLELFPIRDDMFLRSDSFSKNNKSSKQRKVRIQVI
jgi:hypothetical protein